MVEISNLLVWFESFIQTFLKNISLEQSILISISIIIIVAAIFAFIFKSFKQELIPAFIFAGILLGPLLLGVIKDQNLINGFAEIGIVFLLFIVGLEMSFKKLKETIGTSFLAGFIQVLVVSALAFVVLILFKFSNLEAIILGVAIAFSSTVVVTKILADKGELNTLHARFIIGIMLAQDILAIFFLAFLTKNISFIFALAIILKLALLVVVAIFFHLKISKPLIRKAASSQELLLLVSIAFLFFFTVLSSILGISIAIGAFIAGILLGNTQFKQEIEIRIKPLRDFFLIMFFIAIGMWLTNISKEIILPTLAVVAVLILFEPLVTALILRLRGYKTRTCVSIGMSFAQLSEFTLIICLSALTLGLISQKAFDVIILGTIVTIILTPYTMKLDNIFSKVFGFLNLIKVPIREKIGHESKHQKTVLLVGCHRAGTLILRSLEKYKKKVFVIDFNPDIIGGLSKKKIDCLYGDAINSEILNKINFSDLKVIISTIPKKEDNQILIKNIKQMNPKIFIAVTAEKIHGAIDLYEMGADYVIVPSVISGEKAGELILNLSKKDFKKYKQEQIEFLKKLHHYLY
ncbi:MAG: cation:proton antiporter [archaeon]